MTASPRIAALCTTLLLAGCSMIGGPKETPVVYTPTARARADPAWPHVDWQLSIGRPVAARMLDGGRILVSPTPGELQVYKAALWARPPSEMLEDGVLRTLEDSEKIAGVARQSSGIAADYRLVMELRQFEADYAGAAVPSAVIEVNAKLLCVHDQAVAGSRTFRHAIPAAGTDVALVSDAFSQAMAATNREIAGWVLASGQAHEALHPGGND